MIRNYSMIDVCADRNEKLEAILGEAATWALRKFTDQDINVSIEVVAETAKNAEGVCHIDENGFEIELVMKDKLKDMIVTLMHEMVHVKQYALGELELDKLILNENGLSVCRLWHGEEVYPDEIDYFDLPWEIEAFGREHGMMVQWARQTNLLDIEEIS
jgi:hypothetical protein